VSTLNAIRAWRLGAAVQRYHTRHTLVTDYVGGHSGGVAWLCWLLAGRKPRPELLMAALSHDLPEAYVGDVPSPTKKLLNGALDEEETKWLVGMDVPDYAAQLSHEEKRWLTLADAADGLLFCCEELERGNRSLLDITQRYYSYVVQRSDEMPSNVHVAALRGALSHIYTETMRNVS
jgi:5'-deoxynucleotidase YfbR-like HD superfamily hydrolase